MSALRPLLDRDRYTDDEWALASAGRCDWITESGAWVRIARCGKPSDPGSFYRFCPEHDCDARGLWGTTYGTTAW